MYLSAAGFPHPSLHQQLSVSAVLTKSMESWSACDPIDDQGSPSGPAQNGLDSDGRQGHGTDNLAHRQKNCLPGAMSEDEIIRSLALAGAPQQRALKLFYEKFSQPILRWLVYMGTSADEAKDVFQETFLKVVKNAGAYSGAGAATAWVWQIARNCLIDHQRKHGRQHEIEVAMNDEQWEHLASTAAAGGSNGFCNSAQTSAEECVAAGLLQFGEQLPARAHALVLQMEGESVEEIGKRIGRTIAATKEYLSQCKKKLMPYISHCRELLSD